MEKWTIENQTDLSHHLVFSLVGKTIDEGQDTSFKIGDKKYVVIINGNKYTVKYEE